MKSMKTFAMFLLVAPAFIFAEGNEEIGTRSSTSEVAQTNEASAEEQESHCGFIFDRYPQVTYGNNVHTLSSISVLADSIEIEDGSVWKVSSYDGYKAKQWLTSDPLMITQNARWFSSYNYRIVNQKSGDSIEANLFLGPIKNGPHTLYIQEIDLARGTIKLTDYTHWEISSRDVSAFKGWALRDPVIIGYNSGWDSSCEALLINVATNDNIRAHQY